MKAGLKFHNKIYINQNRKRFIPFRRNDKSQHSTVTCRADPFNINALYQVAQDTSSSIGRNAVVGFFKTTITKQIDGLKAFYCYVIVSKTSLHPIQHHPYFVHIQQTCIDGN